MISALLLSDDEVIPASLREDLDAVGLRPLAQTPCRDLVRDVLRHAPDVVIAWLDQPDARFFAQLSALRLAAPTPVVVFTNDPDVDLIEQALKQGVHAWEVQGYGRHRLRAVVHQAQLRCRQETAQQLEREELQSRFEERKLVDRAKGLLMRGGSMSEDDAFRTLRGASQRMRRRVGDLSRQIIHAARDAEAINRAGQLRMLSQRLVKLDLLLDAGTEPAAAAALMVQTSTRIAENLALLRRNLSAPTYGDLIEAAAQAWQSLGDALREPVAALTEARLERIEHWAEQLLQRADALTQVLEAAALDAPLRVINLAGRQRMLSQRLVKQQLLLERRMARAEDVTLCRDEFEQALAQLEALPLRTQAITEHLTQARAVWGDLLQACTAMDTPEGRRQLGASSEALLDLFERLTDEYEHSLQTLMA